MQRVAIARALIHRPALILADEPTGNLDASNAARVLDLLCAQSRAQGAACLIVTHAQAAADRADRVLRLTATGVVAAQSAAQERHDQAVDRILARRDHTVPISEADFHAARDAGRH